MMYITMNNGENERTHIWWTGCHLPPITSKVITFQADGDELETILAAMRKTRNAVEKTTQKKSTNTRSVK